MKRFGRQALLASAVATLLTTLPADAQRRKPPYYASVAAGEARMRSGPGKNYPTQWVYRRADLPIKVVDVYQDWRRVEDPDGTRGWFQVGLLSDRRTAYVAQDMVELRASPQPGAAVAWRAAKGVVGRLSRCTGGWCYFDVRGRGGYVEQARLWGVDPGEAM
ncbi:hypothetical protein ASG37_12245 [Sphingomonas sp. Leaf407]|uniref:SH3 domain-containing protein n=1 Tax=unclassified Sphingomonas TaxID=196159 RepID=UPI0006F55012|nr:MULTISPECIES: SH3 domain-containing protein [unclassified Sphingomonas]KQN37772.1 hypothetical protein ASE97_09535 [Sphingomonas sp. Leaf42]KQT28139.1 hypothetical protein ASG37_12245 [Sphingomonas sp. Leaf407]